MSLVSISFLSTFIMLASIYSLVAIGGLISSRSGVVNISLDGTMIIGALAFASIMQWDFLVNNFGFFAFFFAALFAGIIGMIYSQLFSLATVNLMSDQVIVGTALNLFAPALSLTVLFLFFNQDVLNTFPDTGGQLSYAFFFAAITIIIISCLALLLWKSTYGLRLRSAGENPYALETAGKSVRKIRHQAISLTGFICGFAGGMFVIANSNTFNGSVNGSGFIAIAIVIFGQWTISRSVVGAVMIAFVVALAQPLIIWVPAIPYELFNVIPFVLPIVALCFLKSGKAPAAEGKPFRKDIRE
ncbi:MAG: hypothetical protein GQ557_01540 [Mycoplasmataceae bacterium]|nr:hypothetical protein [Mycoplasmataceae bacterium]